MKSADELEIGKTEGRGGSSESSQGEATGIVTLPSNAGISVPSIANITTALITSAIPLTMFQNGLALNASLMVPQSTFQNVNPSLVEFNGQGAQILPNDVGVRLVSDSSFKPSLVIGKPATSAAMPIKRETDDDDFSETDDDESSSNQEWTSPGNSRLQSDESAVDYSVSASNYNSTSNITKSSTKKMKTSTGSRRSGKDTKLTPEEEERRKLRRERNKLAAAKCRQKRVDQTNQLLAETQVLEEEQSRLEEEIKKYQQQKEELEFVLEAHRLQCGLGKQTTSIQPVSSSMAVPLSLNSENALVVKPENLEEPGKDLKPQATAVQGPRVVSLMQRPTSFPMVSRTLLPGLSAVTQAIGIPISTPSSGIVITLGLDSMLDGHTGLTPITGVPSIVAQTPQNPSNDVVPSATDTLTPASTALMSL